MAIIEYCIYLGSYLLDAFNKSINPLKHDVPFFFCSGSDHSPPSGWFALREGAGGAGTVKERTPPASTRGGTRPHLASPPNERLPFVTRRLRLTAAARARAECTARHAEKPGLIAPPHLYYY
eukprot:1181200-Prorocentrum_minimum.AAC.5